MSQQDVRLDPLELFPFGCVPKAGAVELFEHERSVEDRRFRLGMFSALTTLFGIFLLLTAISWLPVTFVAVMTGLTAGSFFMAGSDFVGLLRGPRPYHALPEGTSKRTARLEDGLNSGIMAWNGDAIEWNRERDEWIEDSESWERQMREPIQREGGWTERNADLHRQALVIALDALVIRRRDLMLRRAKIESDLKGLRLTLASGSEPLQS